MHALKSVKLGPAVAVFLTACTIMLIVTVMVSRRTSAAPGSGFLTESDVPSDLPVKAIQENFCSDCHSAVIPSLVAHWRESTHAEVGVDCLECHRAEEGDADGFHHNGAYIATVVTPRDCARCHEEIVEEFEQSHHAKAGNILASLDNFLAEFVEGSPVPFIPVSPTPGREVESVNGLASVNVGCLQCHGSKLALQSTDGGWITVDDLKPGADGKPTDQDAYLRIALDEEGRPIYRPDTWPNTGIGRINLDGSIGSCSACHSRHDFSRRRARQPENCGKCHMGPDHPQKEIFEESKHGIAYRDLRDEMDMDSPEWVLGRQYNQAPTCATCHMSANLETRGRITHDTGERISWTNRPVVSLVMDTDINHEIVTSTDPEERARLTVDSAEQKRARMESVCRHCHSPRYIDAFYQQYDEFIILYNEKFAKPGQMIMEALRDNNLISDTQFDEKIEWTWFYLWHHEGRRARHGASMMAPDYAHWYGMYEVAERFYMELIPQAREITSNAVSSGQGDQAARVNAVIDMIMSRPEHQWIAGDK